MPVYFPSFVRSDAEIDTGLDHLDVLYEYGRDFAQGYALTSIAQTLGLIGAESLTPITLPLAIVKTIFMLIDLFSIPTRIDIQKDVIETVFDPLMHFVERNYCFPITSSYFKVLESDEVQAVFAARPDLAAFAEPWELDAHCLIDADIGLKGFGSGMDSRITRQFLGNAGRNGWTSTQVAEMWRGLLNAAGCGPDPNGPPPLDGPIARAAAGIQLGQLLARKYWQGHAITEADFLTLSDYYVQTGTTWGLGGAFVVGDFRRLWRYPSPGSDTSVPVPPALSSPQAGHPFSPPCMGQGQPQPSPAPQPQPQPAPQPQPQPSPSPAPQPSPQPAPQPGAPYTADQYTYICGIRRKVNQGGTLTVAESSAIQYGAGAVAWADTANDPACQGNVLEIPPQPQPQPQPQPSPQPQPQPSPQPQPQPPSQPGQPQLPICPPWPQPFPEPQPQPSPQPGPQDGPCPPDCQDQIDLLEQQLRDLPLQDLSELPAWQPWIEQRINDVEDRLQECCDRPDPQPQPQTDCPPECQQQITELGDQINNFPQQIQQTINNFYETVVQPKLDECCDRPQVQQRALECVRLLYCDIGRQAWGMMAECWLEEHTEEPPQIGLAFAGVSFPQAMVEGFVTAGVQGAGGRYADDVQVCVSQFLDAAEGKGFDRPSPAAPMPRPAFLYTAPDQRAGSIMIRSVRPLPDEVDPCATLEVGNG